jgi:putative hydrolase of the HAD superfamily
VRGSLAHVEVVVFDIDDTLFLEEDYIRSGFSAVAESLAEARGVSGFARRCWALHESGVRGEIFDRALEQCGITPDPNLIASLVERYRSHRPTIELASDARRALDVLGRDRRLAAVSDGPLICQQAKVEALALTEWLDPIVLTDRYPPGHGKPHPRAFTDVEDATGRREAGLVYVADNPAKDFIGPRARGWRTVRIQRPRGLYRQLPHTSGEVDELITDLDALVSLVTH